MKLNILHLNVERSKHLDSVLQLIENKNPDIVCFEEAILQDVKKISSELKYEFAFAPRLIIKNTNHEDQEGSAILSRYPIKNTVIYRYDENKSDELLTYLENELASRNNKRQDNRFLLKSNILTIEIESDNDGVITIATTHFPVADHNTLGLLDHEFGTIDNIDEIEKTRAYLDRFISIIRSINQPIILTADLNNTRGEYVYDTLAHELIDIVPDKVTSTIDSKLHRVPNLQLVVDTIMISSDITVDNFEMIEGVSDHKALITLLNI